MPVLPPSFLVQPTFVIGQLKQWPKKLSWSFAKKLTPIPVLPTLDDRGTNLRVWIGWHARGLIVAAEVSGKAVAPQVFPSDAPGSDSVVFSFDTRDTKSIHRAGRFCQRFRLLPPGKGKQAEATIRQEPVPRSREDAPFRDLEPNIYADVLDDGYRIVATIAANNLNGFDPSDSPKLGFFAELHDLELGRIPLTGDTQLPSEADPSMWSTIELVDETDG